MRKEDRQKIKKSERKKEDSQKRKREESKKCKNGVRKHQEKVLHKTVSVQYLCKSAVVPEHYRECPTKFRVYLAVRDLKVLVAANHRGTLNFILIKGILSNKQIFWR